MTGLKIEGDLSKISDRQVEYIKSVIENRGYKNNKVTIAPVGKAGDNYVANVVRITVEDEKGNFKMVAKIAPHNPMQREMSNTGALFRNEHIMYTQVLPKFTQLEKSHEVPVKDRLKYAICYGTCLDAPNEVIILEDLKESDFVMLDRFTPLKHEYVKSVLKNFALLHSLSFALKYKEPELYDEYMNSLFDAWVRAEDNPTDMAVAMSSIQEMDTNVSALLESDIHKKAVKNAVIESIQSIIKLSKIDKYSKQSVIQQGDAWTNNIMFKFDGETLEQSVMIDYQTSKPANPVADLLYMIGNCTDYQTRKEHYYEWIDYYHSELDKALSNYNLKTNFVYPRDQLDVDLKRYGKTSFGQSILLASILTLKTEEAVEMRAAMEAADINAVVKSSGVGSKDPETIAILKNRIGGLVDSYKEFGLI